MLSTQRLMADIHAAHARHIGLNLGTSAVTQRAVLPLVKLDGFDKSLDAIVDLGQLNLIVVPIKFKKSDRVKRPKRRRR